MCRQKAAIGLVIAQVEVGERGIDLLVFVRCRCTKHGMGSDHYASLWLRCRCNKDSTFRARVRQIPVNLTDRPPND